MTDWKDHKVPDLPEGESGPWRVDRFTVSQADSELSALRGMLNGHSRHCRDGTYTRLIRKGVGVVMSDTRDEISDHLGPIGRARGSCLVNGLGLGVVANAMLEGDALRVTVIEIDPDVIALVGPHWLKKWGDRIQIIQADAFDYQPEVNQRYHVVWHDIWPHIREDNLPGMHRLHRKYGSRADWQGSWCRVNCERARG